MALYSPILYSNQFTKTLKLLKIKIFLNKAIVDDPYLKNDKPPLDFYHGNSLVFSHRPFFTERSIMILKNVHDRKQMGAIYENSERL